MQRLRFACVVFFLAIAACSKPAPQPIVLPQPTVAHQPLRIHQSGKISRDLFRSFWELPSQDTDSIHLGIIPSAPSVSFSSKHDFRIRIHQEHSYWDIFSPAGVNWDVRFAKQLRPELTRYFCTIDYKIKQPGKHISNNSLLPWIQKGYKQSQWVGPPKMDAKSNKQQLTRFFLSVADFHHESDAIKTCQTFTQTYGQKCSVIGRIELPLLGAGKLIAKNSNFEKNFTGMIELIPQKNSFITVHDVPVKLLTQEKKSIAVRDQLFITPNRNNEFSVVEALPLHNYLEGVLPSEIYPSAPLEALKSQAIIARTYTLSQLWSHYSLEPFYTCVTTQCQAYQGNHKKHANVTKAITQTQNLVLKTQNLDFAPTFYHASSGGKTDHAATIFSHSPYVTLPNASGLHAGTTNDFVPMQAYDLTDEQTLRAIIQAKRKTFGNSTRFSTLADTWTRHFSSVDLKQIFGAPVLDIVIHKRSVSGRAIAIEVTTLRATKKIVNELRIRKKLRGLPSSLMIFDIQKGPHGQIQNLSITGRGRGHGVGLSQMGAIGRADRGQNYQQILRAYYPQTILTAIMPQ